MQKICFYLLSIIISHMNLRFNKIIVLFENSRKEFL